MCEMDDKCDQCRRRVSLLSLSLSCERQIRAMTCVHQFVLYMSDLDCTCTHTFVYSVIIIIIQQHTKTKDKNHHPSQECLRIKGEERVPFAFINSYPAFHIYDESASFVFFSDLSQRRMYRHRHPQQRCSAHLQASYTTSEAARTSRQTRTRAPSPRPQAMAACACG